MREILFRGKDYKGNWRYGSLVKKTYIQTNWDNLSKPKDIINYSIVSKPEFAWTDEYDTTEIVDKTIGQYTGLTDKDGNNIFEGDILEYEFEDIGKQRAFVCWNGKYASFTLEVISEDFEYTPVEAGCIIGNIYDNPELLEEKI